MSLLLFFIISLPISVYAETEVDAEEPTEVYYPDHEGEYGMGYDGWMIAPGMWNGTIDYTPEKRTTPRVGILYPGWEQLDPSETTYRFVYVPKLDDIMPRLETRVHEFTDVNGDVQKYAAVWTGSYDNYFLTHETDGETTTMLYNDFVDDELAEKATEVLGADILLDDETAVNNNGTVTMTQSWIQDNNITLMQAMECIYKTYEKYSYRSLFGTMDLEEFPIDQVPIYQMLTQPMDDPPSGEKAKIWYWETRSNKKGYVRKARHDYTKFIGMNTSSLVDTLNSKRIVENNLTIEGVNEKDDSKSQPISLGEFCRILKTMMINYGEPTMTSEEEMYLIQLYGKYMPWTLETDETVPNADEVFDAIQYLIAKGILNHNITYDFTANLSVEQMLDMLCAVKSPDYRYTFKDITLTLDKELLDKGYFETDIASASSPIVDIYSDAVSGAQYYDYYVQIEALPTTVGDVTNLKLCLVSNSGSRNHSKSNGTFQFVGITDEYYHFKIYASKKRMAEYIDSSNRLRVASSETPEQFRYLKYGGGFYTKKSKYGHNTKWEDFTGDETPKEQYISASRKRAAQEETEGTPTAKSVAITFTLLKSDVDGNPSVLDTLQWAQSAGDTKGEPLSDLKTKNNVSFGDYTITKSLSKNLYVFKVTGCKNLTEFRKHILHTGNTDRYNEYKCYLKKNSNILVNFSYLIDIGAATKYMQLDNDVILLSTSTNNIYLCPKQHIVIAGNVLYNVPEDTILTYEADGQFYVDYRAAMGWAGDYFIFSNANGKVTVSLPKAVIRNKCRNKNIVTPFSDDGKFTSQVVWSYDDSILLSSTYPLANYFIYSATDNTVSADSDYLFTFKLRNQLSSKGTEYKYTDDLVARNALKGMLGCEAPEEWLVCAYVLDPSSGKDTKNPPGITYDKQYGYIYKPVKYTEKTLDSYYKSCLYDKNKLRGTGKSNDYSGIETVLPIVDVEGTWYDVNFNSFSAEDTQLPYGSSPVCFISNLSNSDEKGYTSFNSENITTGKANAIDYEITPAPTGIISHIFNLGSLNYRELLKPQNQLYAGTMVVSVKDTRTGYHIMLGEKSLGIIDDDSSLQKLSILRSTRLGYVCSLYQEDIKLKISDAPDGSFVNTFSSIGTSLGESLSGFDWEKYTLETMITDADDAITIATIVVLTFLPRLFMFLFLCLIALSLIVNVRFWQRFCDNVFDIYKFISFNRLSVHTVNTFNLFWTSILGLAVFGLFMDGTVLNLLAWLAEFITTFYSR